MKAEHFLRELTYRGAAAKYKTINQEVRDRLEHELNIINTLGYAGYFLVVWDIVNYAAREKIRFAGRGSAADSLVAYCLGITEVDSLSRGLLFERFMSLERREKPDIDIDFDSRHRDKVVDYVYQKYGQEHVASVCTYNTFRGRSALRDIGKALGMAEDEIGLLAKKLPFYSQADRIRDLLPGLPELRASGLNQPKFKLLLDLCEGVAGFPRFLGTHMGGLVISREPIVDLTPLQQAAKGVPITQFDRDDVEELGLVKLDLLSLRILTAVDDAVISIKKTEPDFDYQNIPLDDQATFQLLNSGHTVGVFQLESPAQRALQSRLEASSFEHVIASVALIRPGPIKGNMVEPYIARSQGREEVSFLHPFLVPILDKTYGVILFQEQVIEIATAVAGFTPGEADSLRRIMTHGRSQRAMEEMGLLFIKKAVERGVEPETADKIFACMVGYASYGFCEAHAAAFATTAFKTAYLLRHYPAQFYAAILSSQPMGYYPPHVICNEAKNRGINILPPHINLSGEKFEVEGEGIRIPLTQIKGLSREGIKSILKGRPFRSISEMVAKTDLNRLEWENLIKCGVLDCIDDNRRRLLALLPGYLQAGKADKEGSGLLFDVCGDCDFNISDFTLEEKSFWEFEILGIDVREHIMKRYRHQLKPKGIKSSIELETLPQGSLVKTAGMLLSPHRPPTRSGRIMVFLSLEDEFGLTDVTVFEDVYQRYGQLIFSPQSGPLIVEGILQRRGRGIAIIARRITRLQPT